MKIANRMCKRSKAAHSSGGGGGCGAYHDGAKRKYNRAYILDWAHPMMALLSAAHTFTTYTYMTNGRGIGEN